MRIRVFYEVIPYSVKFEGCIALAFPIMLVSKPHCCAWESSWDAADPSHNSEVPVPNFYTPMHSQICHVRN